MIGKLQRTNPRLEWGITADRIGFIAIHGWSEPDLPERLDAVLEEMRATRGLIVDVRLNGGGSEPLARAFAGRFLEKEYTYSYSQYRIGPRHTDMEGAPNVTTMGAVLAVPAAIRASLNSRSRSP